MVKTKGSKDKIKHRKRRSDVGKKREFYNHKKTKPRHKVNGNFVSYISKRKRDDPIKVWFWSVEPMSHQGLMNFNKDIRRKMHRFVYGRNKVRIDVYPEVISTKDNISELALEYLWEGTWHLKLWGNSKNKFHTSARTVAVIKITNHPDGMRCRVIPAYNKRSLRRYWFWRDR